MIVTAIDSFGAAEASRATSVLNKNAADPGPPRSRVKIFLVEDHVLFRTQLAAMITRDPRILICGEADTAFQALEMIPRVMPHLAIVDITLKGMNGLDLVRELKSLMPELTVLVLSMHDES